MQKPFRKGRYRLGVRTEDSQSSNPGSIPGSATSSLLLSPDISYACCRWLKRPETRRNTWWGTVGAEMGHNLGHRPCRGWSPPGARAGTVQGMLFGAGASPLQAHPALSVIHAAQA